MFQYIAILLVGSVFSFTLRDGHDECCASKTVGDVTYELVNKMDTSGYGCISNCVYQQIGGNSSSSFCFKRGDLPVTCGDDDYTGCPCNGCSCSCCGCNSGNNPCSSCCTSTSTPPPNGN